jgi:dihydroorotate dehydrogenase (NAD+) catalytic subunit
MHRLVKGQSVEILYRVVGPGTSWLAKRQAEDVLDVLGPFGNGFNIEETLTHAVLVARGVGIAPLYALGEVLKRESPSVRVSVLMGARLKERIFYRNELEALGSVHCYTEVPSGLLSIIGLQNVGVARFIQAKLPFFYHIAPALIVSIGGESVAEYVTLARILEEHPGIHALELNVSCPNVLKGGMHFGVDPPVMEDLLARVRPVTGKPLIVKLTPMVTDICRFAEIAQRRGADAVSLINAPPGMAVDIKTKRSRLGRNPTGGLTGPAIRPLALFLVRRVFKSLDIPIIGIGGIASWENAVEFFLAGASAVQIGTMNFINPGAAADVLDGIQKYLLDNEMRTISQLIGTLRE